MDTIGIGIIGCGGRSTFLVSLLPELGKRFRVHALYDPSARSIRKAQEHLGSECTVYEDYRELVHDPRIDWVVVGSWNCFHREQVIAALMAGKHVFCEKPLATTLEDCVAIQEVVQYSDCHFVIGFVLRYSPHYRKIKKVIDSGAIGRVISLECNETLCFNHGGFIHADWRRLRRNAGTHLLEKCCHDIDLVNWLIGSRARWAASFGGCNFFTPAYEYCIKEIGRDEKGRDAYRAWPSVTGLNPFTANKDIFDNQVAILEYENEVRATFHTNCNAGIAERRMYILGTEGAIRADVLSGQLQLQRIGFTTQMEDLSGEALGGHGGADRLMVEEWSEMMRNEKIVETGIDDAIHSAITCFGIDRAADTKTVTDMQLLWNKLSCKQCGVKEICG